MNKNRHRLVFSKTRGMLIAVEETAAATGKTAGQTRADTRPATPRRALFTLRQIAFAALALLGALPAQSGAQIAGGGAHAPNVIQTQNGLDQVNINRPSGAGVSVNTYNRFDVQSRGAILNNSPTIVQTQQAGMINGNPNFGPGQSARIIVNQVNSLTASQLNGHLEVAGSRAEVVIANPSGIAVNGGGFINTSRAILTTGTPNYAPDGSLSGFNVTGGNITVNGAGLNASNVDQVDLLARAVQANAAIYANNLNVITGANSIQHDTLAATPIAGDGPAPGVSIDVSNLGGMYANRVFLVGTEAGVGVSLKGVVAANAGDLVLTTQGKLVLASQASASGNLSATARDSIDNSGMTYAQQNVSLGTGGALTNSGLVGAQQNTTISAGSVSSTGTLAAGVNGDGALVQPGDLSVSAAGALTATGRNAAGGNAVIGGAAVNLAGSGTSANGALVLAANGGDLNLSGATTTAGSTLDARASGALTNDYGAMSSGGAQHITAGALSNRGGQMISGSTLTGNISGATSNQGGTLQANAGFSMASGSLDNTAGHIASLNADGVDITIGGQLNNGAGGSIGGNGNVVVQAGQITNAGSITAVQSLIAQALQTLFNGGTFAANANMTLAAGSTLTNTSQLTANGGLALSAATFDNSQGLTSANQLALHAVNLVNRGGTIAQSGNGATTLDVSGTLDNTYGSIQTNADNFALDPSALLNDHGVITNAGMGTLAINTGTLSNTGGTIVTNGALSVNVSGALSNVGGTVQSAKQLSASSGSLDNTGGHIASLGTDGVNMTTAGLLNNGVGGSIGGNGSVALQAGQIANAGSVTAVQSLIAQSVQTLFNSGTFAANVDMTLTAGTTLTNASQFAAGRALTLSAATFDNSGATTRAGQFTLHATNFLNRGGSVTQTGTGATTLEVSDTLDNTDGAIQSNADGLALDAGALLNDRGTVANSGTGGLSVNTGTLSNGAGRRSRTTAASSARSTATSPSRRATP
ncbi:filamentous hemagglutinin N-terminal domain-containing protein [Paraburkholderia pallida]|uniref:two-partner secretion domain-containing protein n=1 Tax=Paraburkholderia pallida TaxID=2547399 RepID=UPI001E64CEE4|nr:filamentous hemagglutinin N-terminal domain-containing protein [Paraburkholderia pallida]